MLGLVLRGAGVACAIAGMCHVFLGVGGDWIVGVVPATPVNPSLDSQNRFYGGAFMLYALLLWLGASDIRRFAPVLRAAFAVMFVAGCARGLALLSYGWPSWQILVLWASELAAPPFMWLWLNSDLARGRGGLR
jgi:Domain of unknown function (DUF4345)